jgi:hypothetical protein
MARERATVSGRRTGMTGWLPVKASATGAQPEAWAPVSRVWGGPSTRPRSTSSRIAFSALTNWEPEAIGPDVDVAEGPGDLVGQLAAEAVGVVVGAVDPHQGGSEHRGGRDLGGLQVGRDDDHGAHRGVGRVGGDGVGQVAGAGTGEGVEAMPACPAGGDAHHPILERVGRVLGVVLQVEVAQAEEVAQVAGSDQRRPALTQGDGLQLVLDGQQVAVAPDARGARLDARAGDPAADLGVVVGHLERAEAAVAGMGGRDRGRVAAGAAAQGKYSLAHVMDLRFRKMSDHACGAVRPPRRIRIPADPVAPRGGSGRVEGA